MVPAGRSIYDICWSTVRGEISVSKCRAQLDSKGLLDPQVQDGTISALADVVAHMGLELTATGEYRTRLVELAKWLAENGLVPLRYFQERCEAEFLWEADMIKIKAPDLKAKEVRVNTRLLYQQTKFNLVREESEGYAKLLTALSQSGCDGREAGIVSTIKSLIGHFDLDPNRVFDLVLEYFELYPESAVFSSLIPLFPKSHICHILGFKFHYYQRPEVEDPVPTGLYRLAATLVKGEFVNLDSIYTHLLPRDEEAIEQYEDMLRKRLDEASKIGKINLAATGKDLMEEDKPGDITIELYAALDSEAEATAERATELVTNQKLGLLNGFLAIDDWPHAHILFERLAPLNPVAHEEISSGLIRLLASRIHSQYERLRPSYLSKLAPAETSGRRLPVELKKECFQMISWIGPYLYRNVLLLQKVCKVLRAYYQSAMAFAASTRSMESEHKDAKIALKEARLNVEEALGACLLPSLQLLPANPAVCIAIWDVMSMFPYEVRYRLYGEWEKEDEPLPMLLAARQIAKLDTRRILKRLAKENLKQLGRMVAKVAHANPMTVLRTIIHQIEAYKDMITPVVDAFKYLTQLEFDVLEYVVLERLAQGGREKLKDDGLNLSDWLQSLASFWGHLCKKYPSMELRGLLQYIVNQLKKGEGIELVILQELMQQMANIEYTENVTEDQLEAMSGGDSLRYHATAFGLNRNNKALMKSTNRLRDAMLTKDDMKLAVPLLILIAQHRSSIINTADGPHIKMISEQYDRGHGTLLQYIEFLTVSVTPTTSYAQLVPSLEDLVHKYHIEPEVAFLIYRPVLGLFKPAKGQEQDSRNGTQLVIDLGPQRKVITRADVLTVVQSMLPPKAWLSLSPELYLTFWELSLQDLYVPKKKYEAEIAKQRSALKLLEESSDNSSAAVAKRKKDKEKTQETLDRLSAELQKQEQTVAAVHQRLLSEKDSWLTSCSDSSRIYVELLQRCIFPRCVFSMIDAVYCAKFVQTLHSLGTPLFNTVNHLDSLMCKTLQPMISCCTEYEAGRLGRFLLETLKMMYHWKTDESVYERECINMPGFGIYYRNPNSPKVTFEQYLRVQIKWNSRLTKLMIQCLESPEYMEIRNALTVLTKISSVFPATKKTGVNIEKRVAKIKQDEREDLKVLATGVSAALASRKSAWVTDEEFVLHRIDVKAPSPKPPTLPAVTEAPPTAPAASADAKTAKPASAATSAPIEPKSSVQPKAVKDLPVNGVESRSSKEDAKASQDDEVRTHVRKPALPPASPSLPGAPKPSRSDSVRDVVKPKAPEGGGGKEVGAPDSRQPRIVPVSSSTPTRSAHARGGNPQDLPKGRELRSSDSKAVVDRDAHEPVTNQVPSSVRSPSHRDDVGSDKDRAVKRSSTSEDSDRFTKRRKEATELGEIRNVDRWSSERPRSADYDKNTASYDERSLEKQRDRQDRDYRTERGDRTIDRAERDRNDEYDKSSRDRLGEKLSRDRSVDRASERNADWSFDRLGSRDDRLKDDRGRLRHSDSQEQPHYPRHSDSTPEQAHPEDRFGQSLPPPPPIPPNVVPHSISGSGSRREEDERRRSLQQRLSPHRDEKRRMEELEDVKRRRDDDRKQRDERELPMLKVEKDRDREIDVAAALSKRRKLKRDHLSAAGEPYMPPPAPLPPPPQPPSQSYERDRKAAAQPRNVYLDMHSSGGGSKDGAKVARREQQQHEIYDREREWEDEKRQRADLKRRHHSRK